jgi:hypothetical protein
MKNFEDIKSQWENLADIQVPNEGTEEIIKKADQLKKGQKITSIVLGVTVGVLVFFFFYVSAYLEFKAAIALILMIAGLVLRIGIEFKSINALKHINYSQNAHSFKDMLVHYYKKRFRTHYIVTPIILLCYVIGFLLLIPFFEASLSNGFYTYIKVSGFVIITIGIVLIFKQIQKEILSIKQLMK